MSKTTLSAENLAKLVVAERALNEALAEVDAMEDCGEDCQEFRALHAQYVDKIAKLRKNFGGQPHSG